MEIKGPRGEILQQSLTSSVVQQAASDSAVDGCILPMVAADGCRPDASGHTNVDAHLNKDQSVIDSADGNSKAHDYESVHGARVCGEDCTDQISNNMHNGCAQSSENPFTHLEAELSIEEGASIKDSLMVVSLGIDGKSKPNVRVSQESDGERMLITGVLLSQESTGKKMPNIGFSHGNMPANKGVLEEGFGKRKPNKGVSEEGNCKGKPNTGVSEEGNGKGKPSTGVLQESDGKRKVNTRDWQESDGWLKPDTGVWQESDGQWKPDTGVSQESDGKRKPDTGFRQARECSRKPDTGVSQEREGRRKPDTGVSQEDDGKRKPDTGVSQEREGKRKLNAVVSQEREGKRKPDTGISQERDGKRQLDAGVLQERDGERKPDKGVSQGRDGKRKLDLEVSLQETDVKKKLVTGVSQAREGKRKPKTGALQEGNGKKLTLVLREGVNQSNLVVSQERNAKRKLKTGISEEKDGNRKPNTGVSQEGDGKRKPNTEESDGKKNLVTDVFQERDGKRKPYIDILQESDSKRQPNTGVSQDKDGSRKQKVGTLQDSGRKRKPNTGVPQESDGKMQSDVGVHESDDKNEPNTGDSQVSDGKRKPKTGVSQEVDGMRTPGLAFKFVQKPRSIRNNGTKKLTWGLINVLQMVSKTSETRHGKKSSNSHRVSRQARKWRRSEMALDGDMEWEALTGESGGTTANSRKSMRSKSIAGSSLFAQALSGDTAAVTVGLPVGAPGPAERIRFKDVLKRRGGLQEYVECRDMILGLWERDVRRILSITDCGISSVASLEETPRVSLLRDIYNFLNYHGYINLGIASKKLNVESGTPVTGCEQLHAIANLNDSHQACESKQEYTINQELHTAGMGSVLLEKQKVSGLATDLLVASEKAGSGFDAESMDIDEKPIWQGCRDHLDDPSMLAPSDQKAKVEQRVRSPAHCRDEESLLDIVNRIKASSKKKKGALQKSAKVATSLEKEEFWDGKTMKTEAVSICEDYLDGKIMNRKAVSICKDSLDGKSTKTETVSICTDSLDGKTMKAEAVSLCPRETLEGEVEAEVASICKIEGEIEQIKLADSTDKLNKMHITVREGRALKMELDIPVMDCNQENQKGEVEHTEGFDLADKLHSPENMAVAADEVLTPHQGNDADHQKVIIVGAGPAGLAAGRHLQNMDIQVTILEARQRVGGRVFTDRTLFSGPVDLGASIITGVEADVATERRPDPTALLCKQLDLELTTLGGDCPLFDSVAGTKVPAEIDEALEAEYNSLLDDTIMLVAQNGDIAMQMSLEEGLELVLKKRREQGKRLSIFPKGVGGLLGRSLEDAQDDQGECAAGATTLSQSNVLLDKTADSLSLERRVMDWHFANLEYGCAAELKRVSLPYWNQDDVYGGFAGPHCMIKGGYSTVMEALGDGLAIQLGQVVTKIEYFGKDEQTRNGGRVKVQTKNGDVFMGDAVLVTVPLGCLKVDTIEFVPPLPDWKIASIQRLGFGVLNKVVMEFPGAFWDESVDFFGATAERTELRGRCFMFWNLKRTVGAPVLSALVVGKAAIEEEEKEGFESVEHALTVLRKLFGEAAVPQPTASAVTKWGSDPFSRGAYSYVAVGASGEDYDIIGRSVENCVFFAGEATCKEHPDTVGGAIMTGLREAVRIIDVLYNRGDSVAEAEAMATAQRQTDTERNEVRDMSKRLTAAELSIAIRKDGGKLDKGEEPFNKAILLQDMFGSAKTTSGRLLLAKEMLQLPTSSLKAFAGTKEGLTVLNTWIQDSMGKDGTQLLRHCVRLLLVVGQDLSSVRQSGIGRTVKEKVVVHTSRDIRTVASQLVKLWVETFRKEKAARGMVKPLQRSSLGLKTSSGLLQVKAKHTKAGARLPELRDKVSRLAVSSGVLTHPSPDKENRFLGCSNTKSIAAEVERKDSTAECSDLGQREQVFGPISESEAAALAAVEAAQAAADAAAKAYETAEAASTHLELPKILSFHKFARREHMTTTDSNKRSLEQEVLVLHGKDQVTMGVDARNCKVRDWSIDFSDSCSYLGSPSVMVGPDVGASGRDGLAFMIPDFPALSSTCAESVKAVHGTSTQPEERRYLGQDEAAPSLKEVPNDASAGLSMKGAHESKGNFVSGLASFNSSMLPSSTVPSLANQKREESCLDSSTQLSPDPKQCSSEVRAVVAKPAISDDARHGVRGSEHKKAVTEYVSNLLLPLYKTRKINKDGFKSIVKKTAVKVIERQTEQEAAMEVSDFLDTKRKIKIRTLVDQFVERYLESVLR